MSEIKVSTHLNQADASVSYVAKFEQYVSRNMEVEIFRQICDKIADRFVAENYAEIAAKLDQQAIANLSVAESAAKIRETLEKEVSKEVRTIVERDTQVWQRGILGGMTRIK